ncbi:MAG: N-formylglutamate amidohydrolase [Rhodospirillales bacterium]
MRQDIQPERPLEILVPARQTAPVVFSSPHSGNRYPANFIADSCLDPHALRLSEDCYVDDLFANAPDYGAPLIRALFPRAYIDVNREEYELDPEMFADPLPPYVTTRSPRISAGLGTLARIVASGSEIYGDRKLSFADAEDRLKSCYRPYHQALSGLIQETKARFGVCLLIDCHSMPSLRSIRPKPDIVLGDCYGSACLSDITDLAEDYLTDAGLTVGRNTPYAGGFITRTYGRPPDNIHGLQIEISRDLYMNERQLTKHRNFNLMKGVIGGLVGQLASFGQSMTAAAA